MTEPSKKIPIERRGHGFGMQLSLGREGQAPFTKSALRAYFNQLADYLCAGGMVGKAGHVEEIHAIQINIGVSMVVSADRTAWETLMVKDHQAMEVINKENVSRETEPSGETSTATEKGPSKNEENPPEGSPLPN